MNVRVAELMTAVVVCEIVTVLKSTLFTMQCAPMPVPVTYERGKGASHTAIESYCKSGLYYCHQGSFTFCPCATLLNVSVTLAVTGPIVGLLMVRVVPSHPLTTVPGAMATKVRVVPAGMAAEVAVESARLVPELVVVTEVPGTMPEP